MPRVTSMPDGVEFDLQDGETLLDATLRASLPMTHACGGRARCSTCRVWILDGRGACPARSAPEQAMADRLGLGDEVRLSCQLRPRGDLRIRRLVLDEIDLAMSSQLDGGRPKRVGELAEVTVFFSDVADFTAISESLLPYDIMYLLNRYFAQAGDIVERNGGYIDKFVGDGMMALFGVDGQADAPLRAVNAALQTLAAIDRMKPFLATMYGIDFDIRIGLHHGEAVIGSVGSIGNERLTAVGDVVNVASRVEAANKEAGTRLLISEALYDRVRDSIEVLDFVRIRLRGTSERITLYEVARLTPEAEERLDVRAPQETMRYGGREWLRILPADELAVGERRILNLDACDLVVQRLADRHVAFNNACPHLKLPIFDRVALSAEQLEQLKYLPPLPAASAVSEDRGVVCRWHGSCYDVQTGEILEWCPALNDDGTTDAMKFLGDISKNRAPLEVYPCHVADGHLWVSLD